MGGLLGIWFVLFVPPFSLFWSLFLMLIHAFFSLIHAGSSMYLPALVGHIYHSEWLLIKSS